FHPLKLDEVLNPWTSGSDRNF
ncbi:hypothetical protein A2U01_0063534, partial [Trifolium medium]|nr:hypothetical protein [Trifolium medium]